MMDIPALDEMTLPQLAITFNRFDRQAAEAVEAALPDLIKGIEMFIACLENGGRIFYLGSGTSGKLAYIDASECPPTFGIEDGIFIPVISGGLEALSGWREDTEDDAQLARKDLDELAFSKQDLLLAVSASGNTPYALAGIEYAIELGCKNIGLCCKKDSQIEKAADHCIILDVGPEIIEGSTRLKAGTAQKIALNMLSSCTMIRLGKVYDNLMLDVRPLNKKLQQRRLTILAKISGCDTDACRAALLQSGDDLRLAALLLCRGISGEEAKSLLEHHRGNLKQAIRSE